MADRPLLLLTRKLPPAVEARAATSYRVRGNPEDVLQGPESLLQAADGVDAILCCSTEKFPAEVIGRLPDSVRILATFSVGYEHIDLAAAEARGLVVSNTPEVLTDATADIALLLLLGAARRASEGDRLVRAGAWKAWAPEFMLGVHLDGKRLGLVGMGRIGQAVAKRARAFGMQIHYHNRRRLPPETELGAVFHDSLAGLLAVSQFLSLHCPSSPETYHLLDAARIAALPDGAVVVNTARGDIVDDAALIAALRSGKVAAAGLDVFEGEPAVNPGYLTQENTLLLPHLGSATRETRDAMGFRALDNIDAFFAGTPMPSRIA